MGDGETRRAGRGTDAPPAAAIVLTGGASRRMGGDKTRVRLAGRTLLDRVLDALRSPLIGPIIAVGPPMDTQVGGTLVSISESPPGGGPAHALATGLAHVTGERAVLVLAADLPFLSPEAVRALLGELASTSDSDADGVVYTDGTRPQWLCGAWRAAPLRRAVAATGAAPGTSLRALLGPLARRELTWTAPGPPPYFDCDTPETLAEAERLVSEGDTAGPA